MARVRRADERCDTQRAPLPRDDAVDGALGRSRALPHIEIACLSPAGQGMTEAALEAVARDWPQGEVRLTAPAQHQPRFPTVQPPRCIKLLTEPGDRAFGQCTAGRPPYRRVGRARKSRFSLLHRAVPPPKARLRPPYHQQERQVGRATTPRVLSKQSQPQPTRQAASLDETTPTHTLPTG